MNGQSFEVLGQRLKEQREQVGLSIQNIYERTKIPVGVLEAIEAGDNHRLPSPVFIKGFLRSYALEVGLEPTQVIQEYKNSVLEEVKPVPVPVTARAPIDDRSSAPLVILVLVLLVSVAVAAYYYLRPMALVTPPAPVAMKSTTVSPQEPGSKVEETEKAEVRTAETPSGSAESPAPAQEGQPSIPLKAGERFDPGTAVFPAVPGKHPEPATVAETAPAPAETPPPAQTASPRQGHELKMVFNEETWVRVVMDGQRSDQGLFRPGMSKEWRAEKNFTIRVGNAGGVDLYLDGQVLPPVGPSGKVVDLEIPRRD